MLFLHAFTPPAVAATLGPITVYWYGIVMAVAMLLALYTAMRCAPRYNLTRETVLDAAFWIIVGGLIGARLYDGILFWDSYAQGSWEIFKIWHGGLSIHGGLIGGALALMIFCALKKINAWNLAAVIAPAVALGQAIGRWGNWFNQELFGRPTGLPWGIPINPLNRPSGFETVAYFHPTFLYESLGNLLIFIILISAIRKSVFPKWIVGAYLILYGLLRFGLEFIKIDATPVIAGLRWPQVISLLLIIIGSFLCLNKNSGIKKAKL